MVALSSSIHHMDSSPLFPPHAQWMLPSELLSEHAHKKLLEEDHVGLQSLTEIQVLL